MCMHNVLQIFTISSRIRVMHSLKDRRQSLSSEKETLDAKKDGLLTSLRGANIGLGYVLICRDAAVVYVMLCMR